MLLPESAPPPAPLPANLLPAVLATSLGAVHVLRPLYGPDGAGIVDFSLEYLSPAGQRMIGMPERPGGTALTRFPHVVESGVFDYYRRAFEADGEVLTHETSDHGDGLYNTFRFAAQRHDDVLVVSFADATSQAPTEVEQTVRESQERERAARHLAQERQNLLSLFERAPFAVMLLRAPDHRIDYFNELFAQLYPGAQRGATYVKTYPAPDGAEAVEHLDQVYQTGERYQANEVELPPAAPTEAAPRYVTLIYQAYHEEGRVAGVAIFAFDVTDQVRARQTAEAAAQQLRLITNALPVLIAYIDRDERYQFTNEAYRPWFKRDPQELIGQRVRDIVSDAAYQVAKPHIDRALTGERVGFEARMPYREDYVRYISSIYVPDVRDGEVRGFYTLVTDVTEQVIARQQVEEANQALEAQVQARTQEAQQARAEAERQRGELERVFEQAPVAIAVYRGATYTIELANPTVARLWGRTREQLIGKGLFEALPEVAGMGYEELLDGVMATGIPSVTHAMEARHERDGHTVTVFWDFVYVPMYGADDQINGAMVVATEATEQVLAQRRMEQINQELEIRVRERTQQLTEQQTLLSQILRRVPASIATLSGPEHHYTFFNDLYQQLSANRTALGKTVAQVYPEVIEQGFIAMLDQVYATGEPLVGTDVPAQIHAIATHQLEQHFIDFVFLPLIDERQQVQGILVFIVDVTDKAVTRQQVQQLNDELQAANERLTHTNVDLDNFVYTASHDLRAPIVNIDGLLTALREELAAGAVSEDARQILELMQDTIGRFQQTIAHLTDIAQLQHADAEPVTPVPLADVLEDVRLDLEPLYAAADARLTIEVADCPSVAFSRRNLRSVVYNLLSNAVKYRDPARPPAVRVACRQEAEYVVLTVQDNGLGLTDAQQSQLFGLFRRLHAHVDGAGIGLYMVKRIVENAGGSIEVQSEPGVGSTFTVSFRC